MVKAKTKIDARILVLAAVIWFLIISYVTAQTEYQRVIADRLADPYGTSTQLEDILNFLIVIVTFIPSGFLLSYPYVMKSFSTYGYLRIAILSLAVAAALFIPFSWYNFAVNFPK